MKKYVVLFLLISGISFAQEKDTTLYKWNPSLMTGLNVSQIAFSNWTQGGENSITWTATGDFGLKYKTETWYFKNQLKAAYGRTKQGGNDFITNDNELFMESVISYHIFGWQVDPYFSNTVRTQLTKGFDYSTTPETQIADFFDPGYITQSLGFTYDKLENIQTRLGIAFQEVITSNYTKYSDDPETLNEIEKFKFETGIESVTDANFTLDENLLLKSKLRLFSRFESMDVWDVRWDNTITAKVNSWLNVNFAYLLIYQKDQSPTTQMKQALQLGIVYTIL